MRKLLYALLFAPAAFFACWIGRLEHKRANMQKVVVAAAGYDPYDLFRGHYLWLSIDWSATDCAQFPGNSCPGHEFNSNYKFYLNQKMAEDLDAPVRRSGFAREDQQIKKVEMVFRYSPGMDPLLEDLFLDGVPYAEWYRANMAKK